MTAWYGKHMWVWSIASTCSGDLDAIITKARDIGASGVIVKSHDGSNVWDQFASTVGTLRASGLTVGAWGYHYGDDVEGEAAAAIKSIEAGADWYIIDAEIEYEGKHDQAKQLGEKLRAIYPNFPIGYSSFPFADLHPDFPYAEFSSFCNVALPQVYWGELAPTVSVCLQKTFDLYAAWGIPVAPVGQAYPTNYVPTADDYKEFEFVSKTRGASGVSFWSMQHATDAMFESIKEMIFMAISDWAKESVDKAIVTGIMTNDDNGDFHAQDPLTREEFAVILDRLGILDSVLKVKGLK